MSVSLEVSGPSADMGEDPADREEMFRQIAAERIADMVYWADHIEQQPVIE